jgi:tetratricopeptide (TPR) repeat protein
MRRSLNLLLLVGAAFLVGAVGPATAPPPPGAPTATPICHVEPHDDPVPAATVLLAGYGTGGFAIRTADPRAQAYFDNGMQLAHAFAHQAAVSAFRRAEELDPHCAMCAWGEAWSRGPTINYTISGEDQARLAALADRAAALAADGPLKERALTGALQKRYHGGGGAGPGDRAFAAAMDELTRAWPDDDEIAVVAADAWMIPAAGRRSRDHLDRAIQLLEGVLRRDPADTGAIHFYIHATEMDGVGARALPYAERLQALAPAASHLVHMPSHTYFWVGRYRAAEASNIDAVAIDQDDAERQKPAGGVFGLVYHSHNVQFGEAAALMDGDAAGALPLAVAQIRQLATIRPDEAYSQMRLGTAYFVLGRYGSRADLAALPDPGARLPYGRAMWRYARGEAAARWGDAAGVKAQAAAIAMTPADLKLFAPIEAQAQAMLDVARLVLTGRAAMMEGRFADAEAAYRRAADIQEAKLGGFTDPPSWWYPIRRSVAAALEAQGKPQAAAAEARKAMAHWVYDPLGLQTLAESERAAGQADDAARQLALARSGWVGDVAAVPLALR